MRAHGLMSLADSSDQASRRTAPIADVLALGHCPTIAADCLRSLCLALAPHLRTMIELPAEPDGGPLTWAPVQVTVDKVEFVWLDETAGTETCGEYTETTLDGLVRITEGDRHVATVAQGRWGLLKGAYDARDACAGREGGGHQGGGICSVLVWRPRCPERRMYRGVQPSGCPVVVPSSNTQLGNLGGVGPPVGRLPVSCCLLPLDTMCCRAAPAGPVTIGRRRMVGPDPTVHSQWIHGSTLSSLGLFFCCKLQLVYEHSMESCSIPVKRCLLSVHNDGDRSSEKLRFDVYTVCLVYADELPKGFNFRKKSSEAPKQDDIFIVF